MLSTGVRPDSRRRSSWLDCDQRGADLTRDPSWSVTPKSERSDRGRRFNQEHTRQVTETFGRQFKRLADQPAGSRRAGFLGTSEFRRTRPNRWSEAVETDEGDEAIVFGVLRLPKVTLRRLGRQTGTTLAQPGGRCRGPEPTVEAQLDRDRAVLETRDTG